MNLEWTKQAQKSLFEETEYIRKENPKIAFDVITHIQETTDLLIENPQMGRTGRFHGTRELVITKYPFIAWYRIQKDLVEILQIRHTSKIPLWHP